MEQKTKVTAEDGKQDIIITRTFDLPFELLFKAFVTPEIVEQWMGTKVLKLEPKNHGSFKFETTDPKGNKHGFNGAIHTLKSNQKIIRTFEMEGMPFGVQLEVFSFKQISDDKSKLIKHVIYESVEKRNENLKLPFKKGINMAHNQLQKVAGQLK